jgi:hypothetical protein
MEATKIVGLWQSSSKIFISSTQVLFFNFSKSAEFFGFLRKAFKSLRVGTIHFNVLLISAELGSPAFTRALSTILSDPPIAFPALPAPFFIDFTGLPI